MRRWLGGAVAILALGVFVWPATAVARHHHHRPAPCPTKGVARVLRSSEIEVYTRMVHTAGGHITEDFGCRFKTRRQVDLGSMSTITHMMSSGRYVAYARDDCFSDFHSDQPNCNDAPRSVDLSTGRLRHRPACADPSNCTAMSRDAPRPFVYALVLARDGAIAWVSVFIGNATVAAADRGLSSVRTLDPAAVQSSIPPASLALYGQVATWTHDGQARSATLN